MSSFFNLTLDTTPPSLNIISPDYSVQTMGDEIQVVSSEKLSSFQEIYFIDSAGKRFNCTFNNNEDNVLIGEVYFNCSVGVGNLYVRVKDEVDNISDLYTKSICVLSFDNVFRDIKITLQKTRARNSVDALIVKNKTSRTIVKNEPRELNIKTNIDNMTIKLYKGVFAENE